MTPYRREIRRRCPETGEKRDLHALDENGTVLCNPRDREAAHRAEVEGIATAQPAAVTCRKCLERLHRRRETPDTGQS